MRWFWPTVAGAILADGLDLRRRLEAVDVLVPSETPVDPGHRLVTAAGVDVDEATARAASDHARRHGLGVLDLVPQDLPAERLLGLLRFLDPGTYRASPLAPGCGALHAVLVSEDVARRAHVETYAGLSPSDMAELMLRLKNYAPRAASVALAPTLTSRPDDAPSPMADMATAFKPLVVGALLGDLALLVAALRSRRPWAIVALAARMARPALAVGGTPAHPRDMPGAVARQLGSSVPALPRTLARRRRPADRRRQRLEAQRATYDELLAGGVARFFAPRRPECPLCGSTRLQVRLRTADLVQCKPGTFTLEECEACGHVFQNPMLTPEGLDFYYRDFYDGAADSTVDSALRAIPTIYRARAATVRGVATPRRWLDVGGSHGHFCLVASSEWPQTTFDALDMGDGVEEAERRGWVDRGHRGMFPALAPAMADHYDVVSMFHYLEHTRDPRAELDAAATALRPGGLLLVEVPDPECRTARALGRFWSPWGQPQHLHLLSVENLTALLAERDFTTTTLLRGPAHMPMDLTMGPLLFLNAVVPRAQAPWRPPPTLTTRAARAAVVAAGTPLLAAGAAAELALLPLRGRFGTSNTYRLLARREPDRT